MAPRSRRGNASEPQAFRKLGEQGRKTGVTLPNTGEVDEQGFQPLESIFSSPQKGPSSTNGGGGGDDDDDSGSQDMDIASSAGPGPRTLLKGQQRFQHPPQSRSPIKTKLLSPARRPPQVERMSSPLQNVTRTLDFRAKPNLGPGRTNGINGTVVEEAEEKEDDEEEEEEEEEEDQQDDEDDAVVDEDEGVGMVDDGPEMVGALDPPEELPSEHEEEDGDSTIERPALGGTRRGRPKRSLPESEDEQGQGEEPEQSHPPAKRGRPPKKGKQAATSESKPALQSKKRRSLRSSTGVNQDDEQEEREIKRARTTKQPPKAAPSKPAKKQTTSTKASGVTKPRGRPGRKPKQVDAGTEDAGETSFMALQTGPPMPKSRGLVSVRRDPDTILQTRSGRHSYKPLNWWAGEQVITEDEERDDMFTNDRGFVLGSMKEIVRVDQEESSRPGRRGAPRKKGEAKKKKRDMTPDPSEQPEDWETGDGVVFSEVVSWEPEYETQPPGEDDPVYMSEEQVALSASAVETKEIRDSTFRFAKTLTMPFMGAGVVDLPPGSEKWPKNSRKMHMVFFVHCGKVAVTVNDTQFRISAGGQWFVPRCNYYSITNDYQTPARIFFAQACETPSQSQPTDGEQTTMMLAA